MSRRRVTTKDIAEASGFSRGTVDRALNNRGQIKEETRKLILNKAQELGYEPNRLARTLASQPHFEIVAVFPSEPPSFFDEIQEGMKVAEEEYKDFGVRLSYYRTITHDVPKQVEYLHRILDPMVEDQPSGILMAPAHSFLLDPLIARAAAEGIPVITFNTDAPMSKRLFYVGQNSVVAGRVAADLLGRFVGGSGQIVMLTGFSEVLPLRERLDGFRNQIKEYFPAISLMGPYEYLDNESIAYKMAKKLIHDIPELKGMYITSGIGLKGVAKAAKETDHRHRAKIVGFDLDDEVRQMLKDDVVQATICQEPFDQGYFAVKLMFRYLTEGFAPDSQELYTQSSIILRGNATESMGERSRHHLGRAIF
ncbi:MAG: substrate-binding domain-containing protein [Firmicutes bacterium]|jgi:LacI family transcriptional regulator|nr:substrate-binding domain-containing protein [Bacillota bacterium]